MIKTINSKQKVIREENTSWEYILMLSQSQPTRSGTPQAQPIIIIAITLFAFSGLMVGFTVGAFAHIRSSTNNANPTAVVANHITPTVTPTTPPTPIVVRLGFPDLIVPNPTLNPDGTQLYSVSIQAKDKDNKAQLVKADGITCRLWLVPQGDDVANDPGTHFLTTAKDQLEHPENLNQKFPQEIQNALVFNPATQSEVQPCVQGNATWNFTLSPAAVHKGNYYLVGLTDWQGKSYNWTWKSITVGDNKK
jgi:hypothetical protein